MAGLYFFICTKSTASVVVPDRDDGRGLFQRRVKGAFSSISEGFYRAGDLLLRPNQNAVPNHLLADGSTLQVTDYPQLFEAIGNSFGGDGVTTFALPDYSNAPVVADAITVTQTVEGGTVSTGGDVTQPTQPGETGGTTGGNVPSGGRPRPIGAAENEQ